MAGSALDRHSAADGRFDAGFDEGGHACFFGFWRCCLAGWWHNIPSSWKKRGIKSCCLRSNNRRPSATFILMGRRAGMQGRKCGGLFSFGPVETYFSGMEQQDVEQEDDDRDLPDPSDMDEHDEPDLLPCPNCRKMINEEIGR